MLQVIKLKFITPNMQTRNLASKASWDISSIKQVQSKRLLDVNQIDGESFMRYGFTSEVAHCIAP